MLITKSNNEKKCYAFFKFFLPVLVILFLFQSMYATSFEKPILIDHTCTYITHIPEYWIKKAKTQFKISYGHTSHGSQIVNGMNVLMNQFGLYSFNRDGTDGALSFHDVELTGDLGNPNRTEWYYKTRKLLVLRLGNNLT